MPKIGYKQSSEHRAKVSAALLGKSKSAEHRVSIGVAQIGHVVSAETREKISAANRGRKLTPEHRAKLMGNKNCLGHQNGWRGGRTISGGYVQLRHLDHPLVDCNGYVREHRLVMEASLGRLLLPTEVVHHGPGGKSDNRIGNLTLFETNAAHIRWHREHREAHT